VSVSITTHLGPTSDPLREMPKLKSDSKAKAYCITLNNPPEGQDCLGFTVDMQYMICGLEVGEKCETQHIQGYVYFKVKKRFSYVKRLWPTAHIEVAKGKPAQNQTYCSKGGSYHEHGTLPIGQGARSDLEHVRTLIDSGSTAKDIRQECYSTYIRYNNAITRDIEDMRTDRTWPTELHILWGSTGTGKSRYCAENFPDAYWKTRGDWWDGYDGHETVVIDEFYGWIGVDQMLRLADRYPLRVPVKGGFRKFVAKRILITSNAEWREWWPRVMAPESASHERIAAAFSRRITNIIEFKKLVNT